jgi:hypothetical protein
VATATLHTADDQPVRTDGRTKRRAKRLGTVTVSLFALIALGISLAFFVSNESIANNDATGGTLAVDVTGLPLSAADLFPTTAADGGENGVEQTFTVTNGNPADVAYSMSAACTACDPGTAEGAQWEQLEIQITDEAGTVLYQGRLADMNKDFEGAQGTPLDPVTGALSGGEAGPAAGGPVQLGTVERNGTAVYSAKVWLNETNAEQEQGVSNTWTFDVEARTV